MSWNQLFRFKDPSFRDKINIQMNVENVAGTNYKYLKVVNVVDNNGQPLNGYSKWKGNYIRFRFSQTKNKYNWGRARYDTEYDYLIRPTDKVNENPDEVQFTKSEGTFLNDKIFPNYYLWANPGSRLFSLNRSAPVGYALFDIYSKDDIDNKAYQEFTNNLKYISIPTGEYYLTGYSAYKDNRDATNISSLKIDYRTTDNYKSTDPNSTATDQRSIYFAFIGVNGGYLNVQNNLLSVQPKERINDSFIFVITPSGLFYNYKSRQYLLPPNNLNVNVSNIILSSTTPSTENRWWITKIQPQSINSDSLWNPDEKKWDALIVNETPENIINFCSQHDSIQNKPFLESENFQNTCVLWANNNPKERLKSLEKYCNINNFKSSDNCLETLCDEECKGKKIEYCVLNSQNLITDECLYFCQVYGTSSKNCDKAIKDYCSAKDRTSIYSSSGVTNAKKLCSTFLPETFYKTYYDSLKDNTNLTTVIKETVDPICYFPFFTNVVKNDTNIQTRLNTCTDKRYSCFSSATIDKDGKINTAIVIDDDPVCKEFKVNEKSISNVKDKGETANVRNTTWSQIIFWISIVLFVIFLGNLVYVSVFKKYDNGIEKGSTGIEKGSTGN